MIDKLPALPTIALALALCAPHAWARTKPAKVELPPALRFEGARHELPALATAKTPIPAAAKAKRWNVVLIIMESTGLSYYRDKQRGVYVMPFLRKLAAQGYELTRHYSPANTSPRSVAAVFTGLYPMPERRIFAMSKDLHLPTLVTLLGPSYGSLFVTPGSLRWYFPMALFRRYGPKQIYGFKTLPIKRRAPGFKLAAHEVPTVGFFLKKLDQLKSKPFFATYYSFVAHWPYPEFGKAYHRVKPRRKIDKYLNNLYLLDKQIERIYRFLEARKLLDSTIIAAVGDHGEAWGQHKNNYAHARASFNENYMTPGVLWQPKLFRPRKIKQVTTHVDLLPTLLDAVGQPYNRKLLQGESLFRHKLARRYVFLIGNEGVYSSISAKGIKLQIKIGARGRRACWAYDLGQDPGEKRRRRCKAYPEQLAATKAYAVAQRQLLRAYNVSNKAKAPFKGHKHPTPR
jgi:membrane-anchored protein YejM (alkaline phosphatase superfamily)